MSGNYRKEKNCLNCGHHVEEHYCSHCGQPNLELKEPFWGFMAHSIGHYFHFDSKFFHTLVPLLTKPGQVTLDYLAGRRARYIHPVSLYIFVSIVYFLVVPHMIEEKPEKEGTLTSKQADSVHKVLTDNAFVPGIATKKLTESLDSGAVFRKLSPAAQEHFVDSLRKLHARHENDEAIQSKYERYRDLMFDYRDTTLEAYRARQKALPEKYRDSWFTRYVLEKSNYDKNGKRKIRSDGSQAGTFVRDTGGGVTAESVKEQIKEEVKHYQPKQFFLLMPLLALFIMWNFRKNRIYYIDHLVFTVHGMTAYFIISILTKPLQHYIFGFDTFMGNAINVLVFAGVVWYLYSGLKLFYKRSNWMTLRKTITVIILYYAAYSMSESALVAIVTQLVSH